MGTLDFLSKIYYNDDGSLMEVIMPSHTHECSGVQRFNVKGSTVSKRYDGTCKATVTNKIIKIELFSYLSRAKPVITFTLRNTNYCPWCGKKVASTNQKKGAAR